MRPHLPDSIQNLIEFLTGSGVVTRLVLFGSRARGTARLNSDYDIAVWISNRDAWTKLRLELDEKPITLLPVDLLVYEEVSTEYRANVDREGIVLYGT